MTNPAPPSAPAERASVIIPTLDEAAHIERLLDQFLGDAAVAEVLVADGGSTDGTRDIVRARAAADPRVRLIDNPNRLQGAGINRAVSEAVASSRTIVRVDAHAAYPGDYVARLLQAMADTGADSVVVRMETKGVTAFQRAVAAVSNSRIGTGGAQHRMGSTSGFIDHGHHAAISRSLFEMVGGYDPRFETNEDAEFDVRFRRFGGRIWFAADIAITYFPRAAFGRLARQYFRYGSGRARTFLKQRERLRARQMIPPAMVVGTLAALLAAPFRPWALAPVGLYLALVAGAGLAFALRRRDPALLLTAAALPAMHFGWGLGFLRRILFQRRDRSAPAAIPSATLEGVSR